jgi:enterochelin esterase family protein
MQQLIGVFLIALSCAQADSFSGRWNGHIGGPDGKGGRKDERVSFMLSETGTEVVGTFRVNNGQSRPVRDGRVQAGELVCLAGTATVRLRHSGPAQLVGQLWAIGETKPTAEIRMEYAGPVGREDISLTDRFPPLPNEAEARSLRILKLREAMSQDSSGNAVGAFWADVAKSGAPLVEAGGNGSMTATFFFRGKADTANVMLLRGRFSDAQPHRHLFSRIPQTDVWFKTLQLAPATRMLYMISENDPKATVPRSMVRRHPQPDELNPLRESGQSLVELPGAPAQSWIKRREDTPALAQSRHRVASRWLKADREILVYQPRERSQQPMPAVYLFDGQDPDGEVFSTAVVENLVAAKKIPPVVIVRIIHPSGRREEDLRGNENFARFVAAELVPFVRSQFGVSRNPRDCIVGGKSYGGLAAAFVAFKHSDVFGGALVQSGAFWWEPTGRFAAEPNEMARLFLRSPKLPLRIYMEAGLYEVDVWAGGGNILEPSRHLRDILLAKGYDVDYREFAGDHDQINWRVGLADGLISLLN